MYGLELWLARLCCLLSDASANASCHAIAVRRSIDFFRLSLTLTIPRQDADARAHGYAGSGPTGSNSSDKSTQ